MSEPILTTDATTLGILIIVLAVIFYTASSNNKALKSFYKIIPMLLLCYFVPSLLTTFGVISPEWYDIAPMIDHLKGLGVAIDPSMTIEQVKEVLEKQNIDESEIKAFHHKSNLYYIASRYFLPASLVLLTLSIDLKEVVKLGVKPLIIFFTGTLGVVFGGPLAILITSLFAPELVGGAGPDAVWKGMTTIAGSWIGGGANQAAMYEIFEPSDKLYSVMITVDVIVAEIWMIFLLLGVGNSKAIDSFLKADASSVELLKNKMQEFSAKVSRIPSTTDFYVILGLALGATGLSHLVADNLAPFIQKNFPGLADFSMTSHFFWLIVTATTIGLILSFTKARKYEGAGASKIGSVFIYFLVATIGMKMDVLEIFRNPGIFVVGLIWMAFHVALLFIVAKLIRAPYFFLAVGSKANIGGAASAPVVAAAFHPSLAPVGVLLAVLGYALGTYGALICGLLMKMVAGG